MTDEQIKKALLDNTNWPGSLRKAMAKYYH